jgi:hypothetical protein
MKLQISILIILFIVSLVSCIKEENVTEESYRVSEIIFEHDSVPVRKFQIAYEGDKVSQVNQYYRSDTTWRPDYLVLFSYSDNNIVHEYYYVKGGEYKYYQKNIFTVENDRLVEDIAYLGFENEWLLKAKWIFTYENDLLKEYKEYRYLENIWHERASAYFSYDGAHVFDHRYYDRYDNEDFLTDCDTFYWENNKLMQIIDYNRKYGEMELNSNSLFTYSGDYISEIALQARRHDEWRSYRTNYYEYNEENLLIRDLNSWDWVMNISYEKGKGNFGMIYYLPQEEVFNKPMFKSTDGLEEDGQDIYTPGYIDKILLKNTPAINLWNKIF